MEQVSMLTAEDLAETEAQMERRTYVDADGCVVDADTGEVIGHTDVSDDVKMPFRVDSQEAAEWALELRSRIEGRALGIAARRTALLKNIEKELRAEERKLSWWEWRFGSQLTDFAKANLPRKGKTWRCAWGSVAFRATKGTTQIADEEAALAFVETWTPGLVQMRRWVTATACRAALLRAEAQCGETIETPFLRTTEAGENVTISTGVDINGKETT